MKEKPERQRGFDRHIGVLQLSGTLADARGLPVGDRVRRQPEGHVASPNQRSIVVWPVSDTVLLLVLRMHSRLHIEIMRRRPLRWPGRDERAPGMFSAHQRPHPCSLSHTVCLIG